MLEAASMHAQQNSETQAHGRSKKSMEICLLDSRVSSATAISGARDCDPCKLDTHSTQEMRPGTHKRVSGGPVIQTSHSYMFASSASPAEKNSGGLLFSSAAKA